MALAFGGAVGTLARHWINLQFAHQLGRAVPYATAAVNLIGATAIGVLTGAVASERLILSTPLRTFVFVGLLGGFTTFSSFLLDTFTLAKGNDVGMAAANLVAQNVLGLALLWAGYNAIAR
jgi:CrcB protein